MTDQTDQSGNGSTASDQPGDPAATPDLETIVTRAVAAAMTQVDARFQGFQSVMDRKLAKIADQFKTAGLSPEEREQLGVASEEEELNELRRYRELNEMRESFPKGVDLLAKLGAAESLEDQLALLEALTPAEQAAVSQAAEAVATAAAETPVPEVDRNNPSRPLSAGAQSALNADTMSEEAADALLSSAGKGALVTSRRVGG